jgi:hypothetical protein
LDAVLEVELGEDPGDVVGDGVRAQRDFSCDLVVALAAGELLEDLELAVGQGRADGYVALRASSSDWPSSSAETSMASAPP